MEYTMGPEFYNLYVEKCLNEALELTKLKLMLNTQVTFYEKQIAAQKEEIDRLNKELDKALNKASSKKKSETEPETF
jgi:hypothetical protein